MSTFENGKENRIGGANDMMMEIIEHEFAMFDKVQNIGGRASCQDNYDTFVIMRSSQFKCWDFPLLFSYYQDVLTAEREDWNLISEKYARMMESTNPAEFAQLKDQLPARSEERIRRQEAVIATYVKWSEEFDQEYPKLSGRGRYLHTEDDTPYETSSETYLRGELSTYSDQTFLLYEKLVNGLLSNGKNLPKMIVENTCKAYGYESLDAAEARY